MRPYTTVIHQGRAIIGLHPYTHTSHFLIHTKGQVEAPITVFGLWGGKWPWIQQQLKPGIDMGWEILNISGKVIVIKVTYIILTAQHIFK